jgi:hypothetical protein
MGRSGPGPESKLDREPFLAALFFLYTNDVQRAADMVSATLAMDRLYEFWNRSYGQLYDTDEARRVAWSREVKAIQADAKAQIASRSNF